MPTIQYMERGSKKEAHVADMAAASKKKEALELAGATQITIFANAFANGAARAEQDIANRLRGAGVQNGRKIDIYVDGQYKASTEQSATAKEAAKTAAPK
jgi:hypothetical protein